MAHSKDIEAVYPLSPMQQGMLFHSLYSPETSVYFEQLRCTLAGSLDTAAFRRAIENVVERHAVLRTSFVWKRLDKMLQVVHTRVVVPLTIEDWRDIPAADQVSRLEAYCAVEKKRGFNLSKAPLLRVALLRTGENEHTLVWSHHHLLLDGWSFSLVVQEVLQLYDALAAGREMPLDLPRPYRDYIAWLQRQDLSKAEHFWRATLAGFTAPTPLTVEGLAPTAGQPTDYASVSTRLSREITSGLVAVAQEQGVTLGTVVQAAWALLLRFYSGEEDVVFGATVSGRPPALAGADRMVGLFINTLPVRVTVARTHTLADLLTSLHAYQGEMHELEHTPLVQIQAWSDVRNAEPLFRSILVFENYPVAASLGTLRRGLTIRDVRTSERTNYPLTVVAAPGEELSLEIAYEGRLFSPGSVQRMLGHLETLLSSFIGGLQVPIDRFRLMSPAEESEVLDARSGGPQELPAARCTHELFEAQVVRTPEAVALRCEGREIRYAELNRLSNRLARRLVALGVGPDAPVGICLDRSIEMIVAVLGILKAGGAYVPMDHTYPADRLSGMIEDSALRVLLTTRPISRQLPSVPATVVYLDEETGGGGSHDENLPCVTDPEHLAYVMFTSGSTGRPKGVMVSHRGLVNHAVWCARHYGLAEGDRVLGFISLSFDASAEEIFPALTSGAALVVHPSPSSVSGTEMLRFCSEQEISVLHLPAAYWHQLVADASSAHLDVPGSIRLLVVGGESPSVEKLALWQEMSHHGVRVINSYGPTEVTVTATVCDVPATTRPAGRMIPIGRPIANVAVFVLDSRLVPVPAGVPGELYVTGAGVSRGYLSRPELTAERYVPCPWGTSEGLRMYRTGDRVRLLEDGNLEFLGRVDEQVKVRGFRIEPAEIEARLREYPLVEDAVVALREDIPGDRVLVAYIVTAAGTVVSAAELLDSLRLKLPAHMVPSAVVELQAIPLTPNGKVDRGALPPPHGGTGMPSSRRSPPRTMTEELLAGIWSTVLDGNHAGREDDFFRMGGHSLRATQLLSRIRDVFGVELPLREIFEHPTLAGLSQRIEQARDSGAGPQGVPLEAVPRSEDLPLSFAQQRLWFLDQLAPGGSFYNISAAFRLSGSLDVPALQMSFDEIVRRHEVLRTVFQEHDGRPAQRILPARETPVALQDLASLPPEGREASLLPLMREESQRQFHLNAGPLFRTALYRLGDEEHVLQLTLHHIIADGWSVSVLVQEFAALYATFARKAAPDLLPLEIQYADYSSWQRRWLQGEVLERQLAFWKEHLGGIPALLELQTDRPRPAVQTFRGGVRAVKLPPALVAGLEELCRREGATLFMTLLAAYQTLLHRYSGTDDIVVGSPVAGRTRSETEQLIGFFVNTLVLRARFEERPTFRELLRQVREFCLGAFAHQDIPFERLVEELQPSRDLSHSPLFQVAFVLQNMPRSTLEMSGLELAPVDFEVPTAKYDLTMTVAQGQSGMEAHLEYNTDLFSAETIDRMLGHFTTLLAHIVADPGRPVGLLPLMTPEETERAIRGWNHTRLPFPKDLCVHEWFEQESAKHPEAVAVAFESTEISYGELNRGANQLAWRLRQLGVGPETLVGICMQRCPEMVLAILATLKAGGAFVPLDPAYPEERLRYMVEDSGIEVLLTQHETHDRVPETGRQVVVVDRDWLSIVAESDRNLPNRAAPENLAYVIYTSGSTGRPKGAMLRHRGLCNLAAAQIASFRVGAGSRILQFSSLSFDASVWEMVMALLSGAALHLVRREVLSTGQGLLEALRTNAITTVTLPPSVLAVLPQEPLPDLATIITAGEKCTADLVENWGGGRRFFNAYGPTETTVCASMMLVESVYPQGPPIGRPIANASIHILDRNFQPVPAGVPGELLVGGEPLGRGYLKRPDITAERFVPNPFGLEAGERLYRTGDLARYLSDGSIEFLGRIDSQVKVRGFRIELGEIEAVLDAHPGVRDAVAIVREDQPGNRRVVAYVVAEDDGTLTSAELREYLRSRLPEYMVPSAVVVLEAMPLTINGKVDRRALPVPDRTHQEMRAYVAPRSRTEERVAEIAQNLLGVERVGMFDNFFELGGHSLLATQFMSRVREAFRVDLPLRALFETPTVADLGRLIDDRLSAGGETAITEIRAQERGEESLENLLDEIAGLSDEEARSLLRKDDNAEPHE